MQEWPGKGLVSYTNPYVLHNTMADISRSFARTHPTTRILIPGPGWRVFILVSALPSAISAVGMWLAAESPRYLLVTKNSLEAEKVLMRIDR